MNVETAINLALEEAARENATSSQHCYRWLADQVRLRFAGRTLDTLTRLELQAWVQDQRQRLSAQSIRAQISFVNRLFRIAQDRGFDVLPPTRGLRLPKLNNRRERVLLPEEEFALREDLGKETWSVVLFAIHSGLRRKEQFSLKPCDLTLWEEGGYWRGWARVATSKTGRGRKAALNPVAAKIASEWRKRGTEYLFGSDNPNRVAVGNWFYERLMKSCDRCNIVGLRWHDLRHTAATRALQRGARLEQVQAFLGHQSVTQTERYAHWQEDHLWPAAMALVHA